MKFIRYGCNFSFLLAPTPHSRTHFPWRYIYLSNKNVRSHVDWNVLWRIWNCAYKKLKVIWYKPIPSAKTSEFFFFSSCVLVFVFIFLLWSASVYAVLELLLLFVVSCAAWTRANKRKGNQFVQSYNGCTHTKKQQQETDKANKQNKMFYIDARMCTVRSFFSLLLNSDMAFFRETYTYDHTF